MKARRRPVTSRPIAWTIDSERSTFCVITGSSPRTSTALICAANAGTAPTRSAARTRSWETGRGTGRMRPRIPTPPVNGLRREVLDGGDAAEAVRQTLQQREAVVAHDRVVDVHHDLVEERIHLRTQARQA